MKNRELPRRSTPTPLLRALGTVSLLLLALFAAAPAQAQLRSHDLRFLPPSDARVIGFHVYVSANAMSYADYRDDINFLPATDQSGVATYRLTGLEALDDVYLAMRSYDAEGNESVFSNEIVLAAQQQCVISGCDDDNACTVDTCGATGCTFDPAPRRGQTCDDGNAGTFGDVCSASGTCAGTPSQCSVDADCPASTNPCAGPQVCSNHMCVAGPARPDGTTCNDGNASTQYDVCEAGTCRGYACSTDAQCGDGEACNGTERCVNRSCVAGTPMVCGDGDRCNGTETCQNSTCQPGTPLTCPADPGPCADSFCDPVQGCRVQNYPAGTSCNDGNAGTHSDMCTSAGACVGTPSQCNVDADCPASTNPCAGPQVCSNHTCLAGPPRADGTTCNDGNGSTRLDVCESGTCRGYACGSDAHCSDAEACNGTERCVNRTCVAGTPMVCGDGDLCNGAESCRDSTCVSGTPLTCPTQDGPCFDAFCDPATGCRVQVHPDGSTCMTATTNVAGTCASGVCVAEQTEAPPVEEPRDPRPSDEGTPTTCEMAYGVPTDVHQVLTSNPETSRKLVWSAPLHPMGSLIEYRADFTADWKTLRAFPESSSGCDAIWSVTLTGLKPNTRYLYRVSGASAEGRVWTEVMSLRTSSLSKRGRFKFAFFASNGLDSTEQSQQAAEVMTQIKKGGFPLVLGGGGYALSNEAMASGAVPDADAAIAAWKEQARVVTGNSIFAPVLGDTEIEGPTHSERAADYAEFMSGMRSSAPSGSYSFDYSGVHFVGLTAPNLTAIHPGNSAGAAQLAWLDANLAAARAAEARWIVVYLHADLFSSERTDPNAGAVRTALGTILQRHGVNLVLSGEGNSYERTRALKGNLANPTIGALSDSVATSSDGVVFVRAGSGGRTVFGSWASSKLPPWSAFRDNTRAVFLRVSSTEKRLELTAFGLDAAGRRTVVDQLEIR